MGRGRGKWLFKIIKNVPKIQYIKLSSNFKVWITGDETEARSVEKNWLAFMEEIWAYQQNASDYRDLNQPDQPQSDSFRSQKHPSVALHANSLAQCLSVSPARGFFALLLYVVEVLLSNMR